MVKDEHPIMLELFGKRRIISFSVTLINKIMRNYCSQHVLFHWEYICMDICVYFHKFSFSDIEHTNVYLVTESLLIIPKISLIHTDTYST